MAVLCNKCGAEMPAGAQFCAACGAPAAFATPPASSSTQTGYTQVNVPGQAAGGAQTTPGYTPVPPPPGGGAGYLPSGSYAQPAATPAKGGGSALKIILIIFAILVGIGILGAGAVGFMVWKVAHAIHGANHGQFSFSTPEGSVSGRNATNFTPEELGTDVYPGAQSIKGGMRMNLPTGSVVTGVYLTPDSKEQVLNFYKGKLGSSASVFDNPTNAMLSLRRGSGESIIVSIISRPSENDGKTKISIVHTTANHSS
ncbi:MAG TPA: zinc-ribbon domain-containing protein [Terracidiphilus sp.]|nr:zinc-ribbon domain-containing protein [Terracidiphilus sp.]